MAANASPRAQRSAILQSPLHELTGFCLTVDCLTLSCGGERSFAVHELAGFYGRDRTVAQVLLRMRCAQGCGAPPAAVWLETGPTLNARIRRPRRVPLRGPEAID